eukprot:m.58726 g.58726  ORF g.58726 m.58726 type:complete len:104 (+) comp11715_c0_seq1:64-375(+)
MTEPPTTVRAPLVFLGGACGATTWRRDIAIPLLKKMELNFFNPQVDDWSPDLVAIEAKAKKDATVLLFVFDPSTRCLASLVEVAALAAGMLRKFSLLHHLCMP